MTDRPAAAGSQSGPDDPGLQKLLEALRELVEEVPWDEISLPDGIEAIAEAEDLDEAWNHLRSIHLAVDRWREEGAVSADEARDLRSRLMDLSRHVVRRAMEDERRTYARLLRDVSHDIRSPLHSIIFLAEALYSGRSGSLEEGDRRQVGTIYAASTSLLNLVNDLLDYARMAEGRAGGMEETTFMMTSVLSDVRHLVAPLVEHHGTDYGIQSPEEARFSGDPHLLCRVVTNLVSNAVEAAGPNGTVRVRIAPEEEGLGIEVVDDGEEADVSRMERLMSQPDDEAAECVGEKRRGRSHGLGLLICGRLVEAAGGEAGVERVPADGASAGAGAERLTRVRVWLPFRREDDGS